MARVLLTGATGFIGGRLLSRLRERHEVHALRRAGTQATEGVTWIEHDLAQPLDAAALPKRIDAVVHLAQSRLYREFPEGAADVFAVNVASTHALLDYAREAEANTFVLASTGGIYDYSYERLVETAPVKPINFYLSSKYAAELLAANYQQFFRTVVMRFFFVYGPEQRGMLIPRLLDQVRHGAPVEIEGERGLRINPIYVDDAVRVFEPALELDRSDVFNIAGDEIVSLDELVQLMATVAGVEPRVVHVASAQAGDLVGDNERMRSVLGVTPETSLRDGLAATVAALER